MSDQTHDLWLDVPQAELVAEVHRLKGVCKPLIFQRAELLGALKFARWVIGHSSDGNICVDEVLDPIDRAIAKAEETR